MFPACANIQPLAYAQGLAKAVEKHGGRIYENTRVMNTDQTYVRAAATQGPFRAYQRCEVRWKPSEQNEDRTRTSFTLLSNSVYHVMHPSTNATTGYRAICICPRLRR